MFKLAPASLLGNIITQSELSPLPGATWYGASLPGDGIAYTFSAGSLEGMAYLSADFLLDGVYLCVFQVRPRHIRLSQYPLAQIGRCQSSGAQLRPA